MRCLFLFLLPFCFFESLRCSFTSLSNAFLKYSGESTFVPSLNVKKCFKPKSMPREFSFDICLLNSGIDSSIWTMKEI